MLKPSVHVLAAGMDPANLIAFLEVARTGSFSHAAVALHLTQPAVSKRVSVLENALDVTLFDRIGRGVELTEAGRALLPRAGRLLADMEDIRRSIGPREGPVRGTLRIGTSHHIGLHRLPPVLRAFAHRHPQVELDIHFVDSEEAYAQVAAGELELGLVTLPKAGDARLEVEALWYDALRFVVGRDHPLHGRERLSLADIAAFPALLPDQTTFTRRILTRVFEAAELPLRVGMVTNYLETLKMMTSVGLGWSVLPSIMLDEGLIPLDVVGVEVQRELGVVRHRHRTLSYAGEAMWNVLREHARATPPEN